MSQPSTSLAPELSVSEWFNTPEPINLADLRGRVVLLHTFQALCPGCVSDSIPQVKRIERIFANSDLRVLGLHTVFEHHKAMSPVTLKAFLHEYRITHPVGVDAPDEWSDTPLTMQRYGFRGTPSSVLIGRDGSVLHHAFGVEDDIAVGARIAMALSAKVPDFAAAEEFAAEDSCEGGRCVVPESVS